MKQNAFPAPSTEHSVLLPTCITIVRISAGGLNTFVLHLYFSVCPPWGMGRPKQRDPLFCTTPWSNSQCSVHLCVSPSLCSKKWHWYEQGHFSAHQHSTEWLLQELLIFCWLFPALCWFSFLPPARLFLVPAARRHLNFPIWSCRLGEGNTTTFRGLVEEQLEVHKGCLQAARAAIETFTFAAHSSASFLCSWGTLSPPHDNCTTFVLVSMFKGTNRYSLGIFLLNILFVFVCLGRCFY